MLALDSTYVKVHPNGTGVIKKRNAEYRQKPRRLDDQNPFHRRRRKLAAYVSFSIVSAVLYLVIVVIVHTF